MQCYRDVFQSFPAIIKTGDFNHQYLTALSAWNEFMFANVFLSDPNQKTLPIGLLALKGTYSTDYAALCAALTMSAVPIILVYVLMSNKIQSGMVAGAVKS